MNTLHITVSAIDWVTIKRLAELSGLTEKAIRRKQERLVFLENQHYRKVDGVIMYSIEAYNQWAKGPSFPVSSSTVRGSGSRSRSMASASASL